MRKVQNYKFFIWCGTFNNLAAEVIFFSKIDSYIASVPLQILGFAVLCFPGFCFSFCFSFPRSPRVIYSVFSICLLKIFTVCISLLLKIETKFVHKTVIWILLEEYTNLSVFTIRKSLLKWISIFFWNVDMTVCILYPQHTFSLMS